MAFITGSKREVQDYSKKVGYFEAKVIAINPDKEELEEILGTEVKKDPEYQGENGDGKRTFRLSIWVQDVKTGWKTSVNFFLEDVEVKESNSGNLQFANSKGRTTWAASKDDLKDWFTEGGVTVHRTRKGEFELLEFLNAWLDVDRTKEYSIEVPWEDLMKGKVKEFRELLNTNLIQNIVLTATVKTKNDDEGEGVKEFQGIYTRKFLPGYTIKYLRNTKYTKEEIEKLKKKNSKDLKAWERFVLDITDEEHGCKDFYGTILSELQDYNASENVATTNKVMVADDDSPEYD